MRRIELRIVHDAAVPSGRHETRTVTLLAHEDFQDRTSKDTKGFVLDHNKEETAAVLAVVGELLTGEGTVKEVTLRLLGKEKP